MKTAVFYDLENIGLASKNGEFEKKFNSLQQKTRASELVGDVVLQKAYISKTHPSLKRIEPILKKQKCELVAVEPVLEFGRKKQNLVDFKMGIDVIATISRKHSIKTVAIASGDKDFGFMCQQIKEMGKSLLVISRFDTTGKALLKICDDWVDLDEKDLSPKFIREAIVKRVEIISSDHFFRTFSELLRAMEDDILIRRYMSEFGLPLAFFISIVNEQFVKIPAYSELGFTKLSDFMGVLFHGTNFECTNNGHLIKYCKEKQQSSGSHLAERVMCFPKEYSSEKLIRYYDVLSEMDSVEELLAYIEFMKRNGMLKGNSLCNRRTYRATVRNHLKGRMEKIGYYGDNATWDEVIKRL